MAFIYYGLMSQQDDIKQQQQQQQCLTEFCEALEALAAAVQHAPAEVPLAAAPSLGGRARHQLRSLTTKSSSSSSSSSSSRTAVSDEQMYNESQAAAAMLKLLKFHAKRRHNWGARGAVLRCNVELDTHSSSCALDAPPTTSTPSDTTTPPCSAYLFVAAGARDCCALVQAAHQVGVQQVARHHLALVHGRRQRSRHSAAALIPPHLQQQQ
jgi:hypothetical protein